MIKENKILLSHGAGGKLMHGLVKDLLLKKLGNPILNELTDSALIKFKETIAFTTDSFVVYPLEFSGADIGKLSVCGTINDLVMQGAEPKYISLALIIEEGFDKGLLEKIINSVSLACRLSKVSVAAGDLKVVEKGAADKIFINTSGIGLTVNKKPLSYRNIKAGDKVILTGKIAQHGLAVLAKRNELNLGFNIKSDCACLNGLIIPLLKKDDSIKFMRDPTRGGLATTLNEISQQTGKGIVINEKNIAIDKKVKAACELLGIDPLYVANEGLAVIIAEDGTQENIVRQLKKHPLGKNAAVIGEVVNNPKSKVVLNTVLNTKRIIDMLNAEALPRIC
ncbi:MAG: hydrogenase expression/formation protein HypE [Candidatus Omnitrophica bacterium]|nr:hydrogenase expression/formation protein HypE [Candidatus Omnitrophota bacterium]